MGVAAREAFDAERYEKNYSPQKWSMNRHIIIVIRMAREAEERRRRLTSHRLLQPRTTASIRNRYLCKVFNDNDDDDDRR